MLALHGSAHTLSDCSPRRRQSDMIDITRRTQSTRGTHNQMGPWSGSDSVTGQRKTGSFTVTQQYLSDDVREHHSKQETIHTHCKPCQGLLSL